LIHKDEVAPADARTAAEEAEAKKDVFYLIAAVLGTLLFISLLMVKIPLPLENTILTIFIQIGAAYLAGARFDIAIDELKKGKVFPKYGKGSQEAQTIVHQHDHGEL